MGLRKKTKTEEVKEKSAVDEVFERRKRIKEKFGFKKAQPLLFIAAVVVGIIVISCGYYFSPTSKVKAISVKGNYYLETSYIKDLSELTLENRYYFVVDYFVEKKIKASEMVKDVTISHKKNGVIEIVIEEETPYGYRYLEKGELLLNSGKVVELKSEFLEIIAKIPYIDGFTTEEQLEKLARSFTKLDRTIVETISEVTQYPMTYDEDTIKLFMRDGNHFFASYYSLETLNAYNEIASDLTESGKCIYSDDSLKIAFTSTCPWEVIVEEKDYWVDELGNTIVNQYGDPMEKKYYTNRDGSFVVDEGGNQILIPMGGEDNYEKIINQNTE